MQKKWEKPSTAQVKQINQQIKHNELCEGGFFIVQWADGIFHGRRTADANGSIEMAPR